MKKIGWVLLILLLILSACGKDAQRHFNLGKWYYEKGLINEAILEFKQATKFQEDFASAHYYLAMCYVKKEWYDYALTEAEKAFDLLPNDDHYELIQIIKKKQSLLNREPD